MKDRVVAVDITNSYPDIDLLPIELPADIDQSVADFMRKNHSLEFCGDGLFSFICRELSDGDLTLDDAIKRLQTASNDVSMVLENLIAKRDQLNTM